MEPETDELWRMLPVGYLLSVALETPVLLVGLSPRHSWVRKVVAGVWLTACTYPIVILALPLLIWRPLGEAGYWPYVAVAEVFAPAAECGLFWAAFWRDHASDTIDLRERRDFVRDMGAIVVANLVSFLVGGWIVAWMYW